MPKPLDELSRLRAAIEASGDVVYDWDVVDDTIRWSGCVKDLFGVGEKPPTTGDALNQRLYAEDLARRFKALSGHFAGRESFDCEYRLRGSGGQIVWIHDRGAVKLDADGKPLRMAGTLRVVTARKQKEATLEHLANYDELTGHFNRARLKASLDYSLAYSARYNVPGAYLIVGVDKLTNINDAFGYETADAVIIGVGQRLDRCLRASDVIGRVGGDRFGIVFGHCPESDLAAAAEKILQTVRDTPIETPNGPIHITVSIGGMPFFDDRLTGHEVMTGADRAMQDAKTNGRNCYARFSNSEEYRENRRRSVAITEEVQAALKEDRLLLAFQPVVSAKDHSVDHYECLLRLKRLDGSLMVAGAFVPVVEQSGLMRLIDRRALELAVGEMMQHPTVKLAINISGLTSSDRTWLRALHAMVKGRRDVATRLIVEITETVAVQDIEETARFVSAVRELGCKVALDDFGAGYTSFRHLKALSVDCVKIDGSFVKGLAENVDNQLFIRTLLGLASGFGLSTVAECVETAADAALLSKRGVDLLQGYYFGRPSPDRPWLGRAAPPRAASEAQIVAASD